MSDKDSRTNYVDGKNAQILSVRRIEPRKSGSTTHSAVAQSKSTLSEEIQR